MSYLVHYGTPRHSGRYPWGSGEDPYQSDPSFMSVVNKLREQGLSEVERATYFGMNTKELRNRISAETAKDKEADIARILDLQAHGNSISEIAKIMGKNESTIRSKLNPSSQERVKVLTSTIDMLKDQLKEKPYLDVGAGVEYQLGIKKTKLNAAIAQLESEGYKIQYVNVKQLGTGKDTLMKVLTKDDVTSKELYLNKDQIRTVSNWTDDGGLTWRSIEKPRSFDSSKIQVKFKEDGGGDMDGVIQIRRGVDGLSLGDKKYAQVRVAVDDKYYMKGMALYSDNMPDGVDIIYNSSKSKSVGKEGAFKKMQDDPENPFGSTIRQTKYIDADGKEQLSYLNKVGYSKKVAAGEEGAWETWNSNNSLSSQFLSKQRVDVAKEQLALTYSLQKEKYLEAKQITNPAVKQRILDSLADDCDAKAVSLQAAGLPRQSAKVILPLTSLKADECYAPTYRDGEKLMLVRYPHAGTFEIPVVTNNKKNLEGNNVMKNARDAIGINPKAAERLSGADFDGDTVVAIPYSKKLVSSAPLKELQDFDPKYAYPAREGMKHLTERNKQIEMGKVSNLISDMTIMGASPSEVARAVKHSMVVIDGAKKDLDYTKSYEDNGIAELKIKYQGKSNAGASTIISRAGSSVIVDQSRALKKGDPGYENVVRRNEYSVDKETGAKVTVSVDPKVYIDKKTGERSLKVPTKNSTKMYETDDAYSLVSKNAYPMEKVYADHANSLKQLANEIRKESINTPSVKYSPSAKAAYKDEVESLNAKLALAKRNAPMERQAQILANSMVAIRKKDNPNMTAAEIKKLGGQMLEVARARTGAGKQRIEISDNEWKAIQAGAISSNKLQEVLSNTNIEHVQKLATPRTALGVSDTKVARARSMANRGYDLSDIADALGVSTSTISKILK